MCRYLFDNSLKLLAFPKQPFPATGDPLNSPCILHTFWSNNEVEEYEFSSGLEASPHASHGHEKALRCSYGCVIHTILFDNYLVVGIQACYAFA